MKSFQARGAAVLTAMLLATLGAGAAPKPQSFLYHDTIQAPSGSPKDVDAMITLAPQAGGAMEVTIVATGQSPVTMTIPAGGAMPAPKGSPNPKQAQGALILQRVAILAQIKKAAQAHAPIAVQIPVLPPGAPQTMRLPATLKPSSAGGSITLTASASVATTATIDPAKAKIKGITPARRLAERVKNAATPSHVTLPDQITATVSAAVANKTVVELSGHVTHDLTAKGKTTTLNEDWSLKPSA